MKSNISLPLFTFQRYVGIIMTALGLLVFIFDSSERATIPLMVGLFTLFISKEKLEDERSSSLRTSSIYLSLVLSYTVKLLTSYLYSEGALSWQITQVDHFLTLLFAIALIIYYFRLFTSR